MLIKKLGKHQIVKQGKFWEKENAQFVNPPPPPGVVNRQGISWEWPPRIGARKKQNLSEQRMNRILSYKLSIFNNDAELYSVG